MTNIGCFIHGVYPRSEYLAKTSRDVDRKRLTQRDLVKAQKKDFTDFVALQKKAHFSFVEDGKLSWQDIFRPIVETSSGITVGSLTRWFDNNSFFRQPIFDSIVTINTNKLKDYFHAIIPMKKWKVTLPSPYCFAKLSLGKNGETFEDKLQKATVIIASLVSYLSKKGVSLVQLNEPAIPYYGGSKYNLSLFTKSIAHIAKQKGGAKLAVHFYFGDAAAAVCSLALTKNVDIVGIDFYKTSLSDLPTNVSFDVLAGIVDGRNSLLENKTALRAFVKEAIKKLSPKNLYISNNSDMDFLPETVARQKVALLGEVTKSLK
ncbi:MAG: hypothetical protein HY429_00100 [Candidatus Levybacteria bacterium]|nr:hypothetical protein [Candidatus Levybacteria bacterium]